MQRSRAPPFVGSSAVPDVGASDELDFVEWNAFAEARPPVFSIPPRRARQKSDALLEANVTALGTTPLQAETTLSDGAKPYISPASVQFSVVGNHANCSELRNVLPNFDPALQTRPSINRGMLMEVSPTSSLPAKTEMAPKANTLKTSKASTPTQGEEKLATTMTSAVAPALLNFSIADGSNNPPLLEENFVPDAAAGSSDRKILQDFSNPKSAPSSLPAGAGQVVSSIRDIDSPIAGFDTLDPVQCYAVGALTVLLLWKHSADLNGLAFARSQVATILTALRLSEGQQTALFELSPAKEARDTVVSECVELVGDEATRFRAVQALLALSVAGGVYDARSRAFLWTVADVFSVNWKQIAAVELAIAIELCSRTEVDVADAFVEEGDTAMPSAPKTVGEILAERRRKKQKMKRLMKVSGITLVGGILFGVTGGIIAPALLSALAGVGVASAAGLAASGTVASGAVVGSLFGAAGAGVTQGKARKRTLSRLEEFDFERPGDSRVIQEKERRAKKEAQKLVKQQHDQEKLLIKENGEEESTELIVGLPAPENLPALDDVRHVSNLESQRSIDEFAMMSVPVVDSSDLHCGVEEKQGRNSRRRSKSDHESSARTSEDEDTGSETDSSSVNGKKAKKKKKNKSKKRPKVIVGSQGLEAAGQIPSLHICICVPAWLNERNYGAALDQFEDALKSELPCSQHIALRWESRRLYEMGLAFAKFWASKATVTTVQNAYPHAVAAASSVAGAVAFAFALPLTVLSCLDYIDNPWSVLVSLANTAGEDLADVLVGRSYGHRPVTLFGYSIGARVIFKCLESLASRGALGIVDNVFLMSAPVSADPERWKKIRPVVAGRIVNGYGNMDWALAFFHRGCGHGLYVAGLRAVELDGIENLNMSYMGMEGHKELKDCIPRAMQTMGVGRGYISLPPAKISRNSDRVSAKQDNSSGSNFTNRNQLEDPTPTRLPGMEDDQFWMSTGVHIEDMPSRRAMEKRADKEKKSKGWRPWGAWSSSKKSGMSKEVPKTTTVKDTHLDNHDVGTKEGDGNSADGDIRSEVAIQSGATIDFEFSNYTVPRVNMTDALDTARSSGIPAASSALATDAIMEESKRKIPTIWDSRSDEDDDDGFISGKGDADDASTTTGGDSISGQDFDWELQRRIWEEQERQLQERGYADQAIDIEMGNKVVLGIGVEIAGCRIHPFIAQDTVIPVAPVTAWFTNCCMDQKGMTVRVFEFEKKRKHLPINPLRQERKYPKILGELELTWGSRRPRGEARFLISVEVDSRGNAIVKASEKMKDGSNSEEIHLDIPRSSLCTMRERREMEAKEEKNLLAVTMQEEKVFSLPAPPEETKT